MYKNNVGERTASTLDTSISSPIAVAIAGGSAYSFSFWYVQDAFVGDGGATSVFQVVSNTNSQLVTFAVNGNGVPIVQMPNLDTSSSIALNIDLRDGRYHFVLWSVTIATNSFTYTLYIDGVSLGRVVMSTAQFNTAQPFIRRLQDQTPQSSSAIIVDARYYATALTAINQKYMHQIGLTRLAGRCSATDESTIFGRQNVTRTDGVVCLTNSVLLRTDIAFDTLYPLSFDLSTLFTGDWSMTMFIKGSSAITPSTTILNIIATIGIVRLVYSSGNIVTLTVNGQSTSLTVFDGRSHFLGISYVASTRVATIYLDTFLLGVLNTSAQTPVTTPTFTAFTTHINALKYYPTQLGAEALKNEALCQIDASLSIANYVSPVGYCTVVPGSIYGYCRHPGMCAGHCSAFSLIDTQTGTFSVLNNACDDGFSAPQCKDRCARIDPISGYCIDSISSTAVGLTPGSVLCTALFNYKIAVNPAAKTLKLTPRYWQYTVSVGVPNGEVTNIIDTGSCPTTTILPAIDGSLLVQMVNDADVNSVVSIIYAPDTVFQGTALCESPCCNLANDNIVTVVAHSSFTYSVPSAGCGNTTVQINQPDNIFDPLSNSNSTLARQCSRFDGLNSEALTATAFNQPIPTNVQSQITVSLNTAAVGIVNTATSLGTALVDMMYLIKQVGFESDQANVILALQKNKINTTVYNPINFTTSLPPYSIEGALDDLGNAIELGNQNLDLALQKYTANDAEMDVLNQELDRLHNETNKNLIDSQAAQLRYKIALAKNIADFPEGSNGLEDVLNAAADIAVKTAQAAAHVGETFIDAGLNAIGLTGGLLGGAGNFFGGLIKTLVNVAIIAAIAYGGYLLVSSGALSKLANGLKSKSKTKFEPLPTQQPETGSRLNRFDSIARKMMRNSRRVDIDED
jgi:hypothetical protein